MDYQKIIHYNAPKDDWRWFELDIVKICSNGATHEEQILDCYVQQLLDLTFSSFDETHLVGNSSIQTSCNIEVNNLLQCSRFPPGADEKIALRKAIQGIELILPLQTETSLGRLNL